MILDCVFCLNKAKRKISCVKQKILVYSYGIQRVAPIPAPVELP